MLCINTIYRSGDSLYPFWGPDPLRGCVLAPDTRREQIRRGAGQGEKGKSHQEMKSQRTKTV